MAIRQRIFSERLRAACNDRGISGHGLGTWLIRELELREVHVSGQCVSNWLNGRTAPRDEALNALAAILKVKPSWLAAHFQGSAEPNEINEKEGQQASRYSLPVPLSADREISICNIPFDLTVAEAKRIANVIIALAA